MFYAKIGRVAVTLMPSVQALHFMLTLCSLFSDGNYAVIIGINNIGYLYTKQICSHDHTQQETISGSYVYTHVQPVNLQPPVRCA